MIHRATVEAIRKQHGRNRLRAEATQTDLSVSDLCDVALAAADAQDALLAIVTNVVLVRHLSLEDTRAIRKLLRASEVSRAVHEPEPDPEPAPVADPAPEPAPEADPEQAASA